MKKQKDEPIEPIQRVGYVVAERNDRMPHLGVMAAGIPNLEQHGVESGDRLKMMVTLEKVEE